MTTELHPTENLALTVARGQAKRGEPVPPNTAMMLILAIDRLTGRGDWTTEPLDNDDEEHGVYNSMLGTEVEPGSG